MGKIFYIMGKSASGKDTIYHLLKDRMPELKTVVLYTTRPMREGEVDGATYHFTTDSRLRGFREQGRVIESRTYETVLGPWSYCTVDDGQFDLGQRDFLMIGTLESYEKTKAYFGEEHLVPIYLYLDDGLRLQRALDREKIQKSPNYRELCRRYLADEEDFMEENLERLGIVRRYENRDQDECLARILSDINRLRSEGHL